MYENTIFEPIYGHSDLGSIAVAIFIVAVCVGTSLALYSSAFHTHSRRVMPRRCATRLACCVLPLTRMPNSS